MDKLTGNTRHRCNWLGQIVLQVEYEWNTLDGPVTKGKSWRDAKLEDLTVMVVKETANESN